MCYHTRMLNSTTNEETPRPEPRCPRCGNSEDAPNSHDLCENCVEAMEDDCDTFDPGPEPDWDAFSDGMGDFEPATGYEADDERPYGWDVPEDEHPDW